MTGPSKATPLMQSVLDQLQRLGAKPLETLTPEQARQQPSPADACAAAIVANGGDPRAETVGDVQDRHFDGPAGRLPIRIYWPKNAAPSDEGLPLVLYIHGGGWVIADLDVYDASPRAIANADVHALSPGPGRPLPGRARGHAGRLPVVAGQRRKPGR